MLVGSWPDIHRVENIRDPALSKVEGEDQYPKPSSDINMVCHGTLSPAIHIHK